MMRASKQVRVAEELLGLPGLTRVELLEQWEKAHDNPAPKGITRRLLEYSAAYAIQVKAFGGLSTSIKRKLARNTKNGANETKPTVKPRKAKGLAPGTRLVREWHGGTYHVEVIDKGFLYESTTYKSLSVIAREITGARWSGPRFFGL
jgi:hypothetical protein